MKTEELMATLHSERTAPCGSDPAGGEPVLALLFDACGVHSVESEAVCAEYEVLYGLMEGKELEEIDQIIYTVSTLCREHEKEGFTEGVKIGLRLAKETGIF